MKSTRPTVNVRETQNRSHFSDWGLIIFFLLIALAVLGVGCAPLAVTQAAGHNAPARTSGPLPQTNNLAPFDSDSSPLGHYTGFNDRPTDLMPVQTVGPIITATKIVTDLTRIPPAKAGDTLRYTVVITNSGGISATGVAFNDTIDANTTLVGGSVKASPVAVNDTYPQTVIGNVSIDSSLIPYSVVTNDFLGLNPTATISAYDATSTQGGQVVMTTSGAGIGQFTYNPPPGYEGADSFTYTLSNTTGSNTATVNLTISGMVWFINNNAAGCVVAGCGRLSNPFSTLAAFNTLNDNGGGNHPGNNDNIFIYESATSYTGGVILLSGQKLIGQDSTSTLATITGLTPPSSSAAFPAMNTGAPATTIVNASGNGVTLNSNNTLNGLTIGNSSGSAISGSGFGTLIVADVIVNTTGQALNLTNGTLSATFSSVTSSGGTNNIALAKGAGVLAGTLTMSGGALSGASGNAFDVNGGTATISYAGTIGNTAARSVNIANMTGGTTTFSGAVSGSGTGINLATNTGATINFTGGLNLSTGANDAFTATGGGTVNATQNNTSIVNTLATTSGTALNVANTTIGASGLTFRSINAGTGSGSAGVGISLNNTGNSGGLTVTGNTSGVCGGSVTGSAIPTSPGLTVTAASSADCSGGTIQHKTGADGSTTSGIGIYLNNTSSISLTRMWLHDFDNFAIHGSGVTNLSLLNSLVNGSNGTLVGGADPEGGVSFIGLSGTGTVMNSFFAGGANDNFHLEDNGSQVLNRITFTGDTFSDTLNATSASSLFMQADCTAQLKMTITTSTFTGARSNNLNISIRGDSNDDLIVQNNSMSNNDANQVSGGSNLAVGSGSGGACEPPFGSGTFNPSLTYNISNNTFRDALGTAVSISKGGVGAGNFGTTASPGIIDNNIIGVSGTSTSSGAGGIGVGLVGGGSITTDITNNTINGAINGFSLSANSTVAGGGQGYFHAVVQGNSVGTPNVGLGNITIGLLAQFGAVSGDDPKVCVTLGSSTAGLKNALSGAGQNGGADLRLRVRFGTLIGVIGYGGANNDDAAMDAYLATQNTIGAGGVVATNNALTGSGWTGSCPTPLPAFLTSPNTNQRVAQADVKANTANDAQRVNTLSNSANAFNAPFGFTNLFKQTDWIQPEASIAAPIAPTHPEASALTDATTQPGAGAQASPLGRPMLSGETVGPINIGTLPPGKSVTIIFDVTVNTPVPFGVTQISNQGTVSGSNFTSVLTDDPNVGGAADPTVIPIALPDLVVSKANNVGGSLALGSSFTWTLTITNTGLENAVFANGQTILSDTLPSLNIAYGAPNVVNQSGITGTINCTINGSQDLACIASGGAVTITAPTGGFGVQFTATPSATGTFTNPRGGGTCVVDPNNVVTESNEANNNCNSDSVTVTAADVQVSKNGPASVQAGTTLTYTLIVSNTGNASASNVQLIDDLPDCLSGVSSTPAGSLGAGNLLTITLGTLGASASTPITITAIPGISCQPSISNSATVTTTSVESNSGNNTSNTVNTTITAPDLIISKSGPATTNVSSTLTYTLNVTNTGNAPANNVQTIDDLPDCLSGITSAPSGSLGAGNLLTVTLGTLGASASTNVTITATVGLSCLPSISNTATVTTTNLESEMSNNSSNTVNTTVLDQPITGLTANNSSPNDFGTTTFFTATISTGTNVNYAWNFGDGNLGSGATTSHLYPSAGFFTAIVTATNTANTLTATTPVTIVSNVNVAILKTVTPNVVAQGAPLTYTLVYSNSGSATATGVVITDIVPLSVTNVSYTNSGATITATNGITYVWRVQDLLPGAGGTITITGNAPFVSLFPTTLTNTAQIAAFQDANPADNTSSAAFDIAICFATPDNGTTIYPTVQQAVDAASGGDTVKVAGYCAGVNNYVGENQSVYINKTLSVQGGYTLTNWITSNPLANPTTLDALSGGRVMKIVGVDGDVSNLTVQNGNITGNGGGINASNALTLTNVNVVSNTASALGGGAYVAGAATLNGGQFISNTAQQQGGGLYVDSTLTLTATQFLSNTAQQQGGGIYAVNAFNSVIQKSFFQYNSVSDDGGALLLTNATNVSIRQNRFLDNDATNGGGALYLGATNGGASASLDNNFFANNTSTNGAADIGLGGPSGSNATGRHNSFAAAVVGSGTSVNAGNNTTGDSLSLTNSIFDGYSLAGHTGPFTATIILNGVLWSNVTTQASGFGISISNALTGTPAFVDRANGDLHLTSSSYAIDRGVSTALTNDIDGDPRPQGNGPDIGADETPFFADLAITKTATPSSVGLGQPVTFTLVYSNAGTGGVATNVVITDLVPSQFINLNYTSSGATITRTNGITYEWSVQDLLPGAGGIIAITGIVNSNIISLPLTITNTATITTATPESNANNDSSSAGVTIADLPITGLSAANSSPAAPGDTVFFTATVTGGSNITYAWNYGDGNTGSGQTSTHAYTFSGFYTAIVTATNSTNTLTATTPVTISMANLGVLKTDNPDPVIAGNNLTYTIVISNAGPTVATNAVFTDVVPTNTTFQSLSAPGWNCSTPSVNGTGTISCNKASLGIGETVTFTLVVNVNPTTAQGTTLANTASIGSDTFDPDTSNNSSTATTDVIARANLAIGKLDNPDPVYAGNNLTYTLTITNAGPSTATNVTLTDTLPSGESLVSITPNTGCSGSTTIVCNVGTLAPNGTATRVIVVHVDPAQRNSLSNTATVGSDIADPDQSDNSSTATTTVLAQADMSVTKTAMPNPPVAGQPLTYNLTITNNGPSTATNVLVTDTLPLSVTWVATDPNGSCSGTSTIVCTLGTFAPNTTQLVTITVNVPSSVPNGTSLSNTAQVRANEPDANPANNTFVLQTTVMRVADLAIAKSVAVDSRASVILVTFNLTVTNNGPSDATGVVMTDTMPVGISTQTVTPSQGSCSGTTVVVCSLGNLPAGAHATITIIGFASNQPGHVFTNTAVVYGNEFDPNGANNTVTVQFTLQGTLQKIFRLFLPVILK